MRKKIITLFLILLLLQAVQVIAVRHSIRQLQLAVKQVTLTVEGREVSQSASNLLDQLKDNVVLIAGMNFPVTGLKRLKASWEAFDQKFASMYSLAQKLSFDSNQLSQLKENFDNSALKKENFEKTILDDSLPENYTSRIHDAAFEFDESMENTKKTLDVFVLKFSNAEKAAVLNEQQTHRLPIQTVSGIGFVIGCILIFVGLFALTQIVNPLIELTEKYKIILKKLKKEQEIALALEKARATAEAKSDFLANMSHELRTPMNAILGFSQLLTETKLNEKQSNYLKLVMSSGRHLVQIINDILDFSKLESGKISIEHIDFNLEKAIDEVMKIVVARTSEDPLDTYVDYPEDIPKNIKSDPTRIKQVLVNLLGNALKFTSTGEVGIIVRLDNQIEHQTDEIPFQITVEDTGIGIAKDKIDTIFESFTQVDESTTRKYGGTGLGLTITHSIIEAMGGRIWVESQEGKGSRFIFTFKAKKGKYVEEPSINEAAKKLLKGKKVFVIDDNRIARKVIKKNCEALGMETLSMAESGEEALTKLDTLAQKGIFPEVILCDIMMSEMYGYELAQKLKRSQKFRHIKIAAVTKISETDVAHYIKDDCFDTYLTKPVSKEGLAKVLSEMLGYKKPQPKKIVVDDESNLEGLRILVAENNITNLMFIQACLEDLKCKVDYTHNGQEAIARLESREYDLCLMDLQMPNLGGIEATEIIRKKISKELPIIALTAAVLTKDRKKAEKAGMTDFLEKPIDIVQLKEIILKYAKPSKVPPKKTKEVKGEIKALVVEDNALNMKLLMAFLKKLNCKVDTAVNGQEAVEKTKNNTYDICFMDIQMPVMGGVEATKIIREEVSKSLPIITVTAVKDYTLETSLADGMNDCIQKPVDMAVIRKVILKYCQKPPND